jgi:3-oxoacyl-[acyl-carrier protein] reductase
MPLDKVAMVTGASRGIGRAAAERLASQGLRVVVNYLTRAEAAEQVVDGIRAAGGQAISVQADVRSASAVGAMVHRVELEWGPVSVLVNNAGVVRDGLLARMTDDDWREVIDTHLTGAFNCTKAVLRGMLRARWGRIISVTSVAGMTGNVGQANYAAAKAGLIGLTRSLAREVASRNVTVNAVAPGFVETDMTSGLSHEWRKRAMELIPIGRFGLPHEVAAVVSFLASDEAAYITGQVVSVDGGLGMQ